VELEEGLPINDLLWSDPTDMIADSFIANDMRRCSYYYSPTQSEKFIEKNNLKLIIRGHEVTNTGYKYQKSLSNVPITLTIFSAPNYCDTYKNSAVVAMINVALIECRAVISRSRPFAKPSIPSSWTIIWMLSSSRSPSSQSTSPLS
jgi:serine/threonine-protein phosphatase 2B catalytic subunit